jgi:hypothetical protein
VASHWVCWVDGCDSGREVPHRLVEFRQSLSLGCTVVYWVQFVGFFAGCFAVAAPIFTGEVTDAEIRGAVRVDFRYDD